MNRIEKIKIAHVAFKAQKRKIGKLKRHANKCKLGHIFDRVEITKRGHKSRICSICKKARQRKYKRKKTRKANVQINRPKVETRIRAVKSPSRNRDGEAELGIVDSFDGANEETRIEPFGSDLALETGLSTAD